MIVVMKKEASQQEIAAAESKLQVSLPELHLRRIDGAERTVIAAVGDAEAVADLGLEAMSGVERLVPIDRPYKLASLETRRGQRTSFEIKDKRFGGDWFSMILGPCTVEDPDVAIEAAKRCAAAGASAIRAGIFKPRTSPFAFQGPGIEGLSVLRDIADETGLPVVSELLSPEHGEALAEVCDIIQIGARNMQNYTLLAEVGKLRRPVLLKRGLSSTLDELLQAADYILHEGEERVILCERGIRTFDTAARFTLDLAAVPLLQEKTHLPVVVDPSHAAGRRDLVAAYSRAATAIGADGLIVETTMNPEEARCDANQQLDAEGIAEFTSPLFDLAKNMGKRI